MATAKEIKRRIKSIKNTAKTTKAMELISTVKMKKAQDLANEKKAYIRSLLEIFISVSDSFFDSKFFKKDVDNNKILWVIITSNRWLCWWYNVNVIKKVYNYVKQNSSKEFEFITLWKKAEQFVLRTWNNLIADFSSDFTDNINLNFSKQVSRYISQEFLSWKYSKIVVFYTHYVNTIKQISVVREFLPLTKVWIENYFKQIFWKDFYEEKDFLRKDTRESKYIFEPSKEEILNELIPILIDSMFYDILIEAKASEHSSRMIAMKNAKDNANKFIWKLTLFYNKARQAGITKEVTEIISGVESMKDN